MSKHLFGALCLLVLLAWSSAPLAALKGPKVVFENTEKVFANIEEGKEVTAVFKFTNAGDQNLIIDKVSPACGCTASHWTKVTPPGKKGSVTLILDTAGINGSFRKTAAVATNDPRSPVLTLIMSGDTVGRIVMDEGRRIDLKGCLGSEVKGAATLRDPKGRPLVISKVENPMKDYLSVSLEPLPGGKAYKLRLKVKAKEALEFAGPLFLSIPGSPPVSVWVMAQVQGPFTVRPHEVVFGTINKAAPNPPSRSVLVTRACAPKLEIDSLVYDKDLFKVERHWQKPGEELLIVITPRPENLPKGQFEKRLAIQTTETAFTVHLAGRVN